MRRPDQDKFENFVKPLSQLDRYLLDFCAENNFSLESNAHRTPSRVLRRGANPLQILDIYLKENWLSTSENAERHYVFSVGSYCSDLLDEKKQWRIVEELLVSSSLSEIQSVMPKLLSRSLTLLELWDLSYIRQHGENLPNFNTIWCSDLPN